MSPICHFNATMLANTIKMMIDAWVVRRWALRDKVGLKEMKRGIVEMVLQGIGLIKGLKIIRFQFRSIV
jgi:hypothetical protein